MICDCCRREVDYAKASFWHNDARICGECLAQWRDPDNVYTSGAGDAASVGNYVRLQHGLPPLAAALAILLLTGAPDAHASRHCLDQAEAARTWPAQALMRDGDGCWTYGRRPPRTETPVVVLPQPQVQMREATLADRWVDAGMLRLDLPEIEPKRASETPSPPGPLESTRQFALFVWIVLAVTSVVAVATGGRPGSVARPRWPDRKAPHGIGRG
jgi:hypothetical protein